MNFRASALPFTLSRISVMAPKYAYHAGDAKGGK
jgi:hypothetical protein